MPSGPPSSVSPQPAPRARASSNTPDAIVELRIPATPEYLRLARLAAADVGTRAGLVVEEIDDLRIAVDELCYAVMGPDPVPGASLALRFSVGEGLVAIDGRCDPGATPSPTALSSAIISAVVDEHELESRDGVTHFRMVKRGREGCSAPARVLDAEFVEYRHTRDRATRNRIIERHVGLAHQLARRYRNRGQSIDDLDQVALLGLLKAVERFEPERGLAFSTFATPTIVGELKRHFRDASWSVRVPRRLQEEVLTVSRALGPLAHELGRSPTVAEVASATGLTHEDVLEAMEANRAYSATSLDPGSDAGSERDARAPALVATLGGEDPGLDAVERRVLVAGLLEHLPARERRIVELRFWGGLTQSEIAAEIGVSQMHVSRLLAHTLERLRARVAPAGCDRG